MALTILPAEPSAAHHHRRQDQRTADHQRPLVARLSAHPMQLLLAQATIAGTAARIEVLQHFIDQTHFVNAQVRPHAAISKLTPAISHCHRKPAFDCTVSTAAMST